MKSPSSKSWLSPKLKLAKSPIHGSALIASNPIASDEIVIIWGGKYTNLKGAEIAKKSDKLVMQWDMDLFSIEDRGDDPAYYINHSCSPNIWMVDAYTLVASKKISIDEEITADYALWEADLEYVSTWTCHCGSAKCRKKITGNDWQIPHLRKKYAGHFSPLINKRIAQLS